MDYKKNTSKRKSKAKSNRQFLIVLFTFTLIGFIPGLIIGRYTADKLSTTTYNNSKQNYSTYQRLDMLNQSTIPEWIDQQIIPLDGISRNGTLLGGYNDIVVHYVGNPNTTAQQNHDFYCNPESEVSSHFIVGLEGEIIQCIPLNEMSAASNWRNRDTISIEVCHPDETGKFNEKTYKSLVKLVAWLAKSGGLDISHVIRHYDITGKECPLYYVQNEDEWLNFKSDVEDYMTK